MDQKTAKKIIAETAHAYDKISARFSQTRQHNWDDIKSLVEIHVKPGDNLVDLGCGNGRLISILPELIHYQGIDISEKLIAEAKKLHPKHDFKVGNLLALPYPDSSQDVAIALASLNHIPSDKFRQQAIKEIRRILIPGGIFIMSNWNLLQDKYRQYIGQDPDLDPNDALIPWKDNQGNILAQRYYHQFSLEEIEQLLSGFTIENNCATNTNFITVAFKD